MKLKSLLNPNFIKLNYEISSKEDAIHFLIDTIYKEYKFNCSKESIITALFQRETLGGTTFETGIAIPHARLDNFNDLVISICVPKKPIIDNGVEVKMVVLILTSKTASKTYLQTLSAFAQLSQNKELFDKITSAKEGSGLLISEISHFVDLISDIKIREELTVEDIMSKNLIFVKPDTTLKELINIFYKNNISYAPVIDENENFIAEITTSEILKIGIPNYAVMIGNLKFLSSFEPFEELLKNEDKILVKSVMRKPSLKLGVDSSIIEAALEITQNNRRHIPVVKDNKILGIVSYMDILKKVIRG
ncbi:MAG: hypothetical protein A2086_16715 [Spirochaetes bacterium GWD1_27_9]|nr:MAG: hypothetical protein A2Z98_00570 [Spirochaetes bacterium GWB1_27_13]OHD20942.1 MAG: hypothetical protein A2Y34_11965 [Spirochaetes bacterium GWC1_27_15]OHD31155.1 MAG: hypothetical protein A2086_16715 [Spirochaetes bacterium GWD1_27_9]